MRGRIKHCIQTLIIVFCCAFSLIAQEKELPDGFVDVKTVIPSIALDLRYFTEHNFLGTSVRGYKKQRCILTKEAAEALKRVQEDLLTYGLSLKVYDAYRPQQAVDHFVEWAKNIADTLTKREFYPTVDKRNLFSDGYIAGRSSHSRGSTVDVTIIPVPIPEQELYIPHENLRESYLPKEQRFGDNSIDMGTGFDCFHTLSATKNPDVGYQQRANRMLLQSLMEKHGFQNYSAEWWHYTLRDEPYPETYFDFVIE